MENGNVISVRPELGTLIKLVTLHDMPTSPMAKVGRSATADVTNRKEFFNMLIKSVRVLRGNLTRTREFEVERVATL
jgi:hypothetical protein